jgi:hypothetical protein
MNEIPFKPQWSDCHRIVDNDTGICVLIRKSTHNDPRYSLEVGNLIAEEQKFGRYRIIKSHDPSVADVIANCYAEAEKWIEETRKKASELKRSKKS